MKKQIGDVLSSVPRDRAGMLQFIDNLDEKECEMFAEIIAQADHIRSTETQITFEEFLEHVEHVEHVEPSQDSSDLYGHVCSLLFRLKEEDFGKFEKWAKGETISQEGEDDDGWLPEHIEDVD